MGLIIILLVVLIVFDILALRWGFDSTDGINSSEWERRQSWYTRSESTTYRTTLSLPVKHASLNGHSHGAQAPKTRLYPA